MDARRKNSRLDDSKSLVIGLEGLVEVAVLTLLYYLFWRFGYGKDIFPSYSGMGKYVLMAVYAILLMLLFGNTDGFQFGNLRRLEVALAQWIALGIANVVTWLQLCLIANQMVSPLPIMALTVVQVAATIGFIYLYAWIYKKIFRPHRMLMVFGSDEALTLKIKMDTRQDKYIIEDLIPASAGLEEICRNILLHESVIINDVPAEVRNDILKFCYHRGIRAYVAPKLTDIMLRSATEVALFDTPIAMIRGSGLTLFQRFVKRSMDIVLCLVAMIVAAPVMAAVAIAIKLDDGGPVFYRQERVTVGGRRFDILKFRSMIVDAEKEGKSIPATGHDPRITRVGRFIRATRLDELPQILNILKGDMSIVGPRPERTEHVEKYSAEIPEFAYRLKVKGGLTGYAQVYGKYNTSAYDKLRLDLMYIEKYSIFLDIKLIIQTVRIVLKKESTEGFDIAAENERRKQELLAQLRGRWGGQEE